jgi:hypothetical protein
MTTKRKRRMNLMITMITMQGRQDDDVRNRWSIKHVRLGKIGIDAWRMRGRRHSTPLLTSMVMIQLWMMNASEVMNR